MKVGRIEQLTHTPGPWTARRPHDAPHVVAVYQDEQGRRCTAFVAVCSSTTLPNAANAGLIAAAPDLLAALKAVVAMYGPSSEYGHEARAVWEQAEAAVKKAEGAA